MKEVQFQKSGGNIQRYKEADEATPGGEEKSGDRTAHPDPNLLFGATSPANGAKDQTRSAPDGWSWCIREGIAGTSATYLE